MRESLTPASLSKVEKSKLIKAHWQASWRGVVKNDSLKMIY